MSRVRAAVVACLCVLAFTGTTVAAGPRQEAKDESQGQGQWKVLKELTGGSGQHAESFTAPKGPWRVSYKGKGERFGVLDILVKTKTGDHITSVLGHQGNDGEVSGSFVPKTEMTDLSIEVRSYGLQWQLAIEQR